MGTYGLLIENYAQGKIIMYEKLILSVLSLSLVTACSGSSEQPNVTEQSNDIVADNSADNSTDSSAGDSSSEQDSSEGAVSEPAANLTISFSQIPDALTHLRYARFQFHAEEASSYECSLDLSAFTLCQSPYFITSVSNAAHTFSVRALDNQGAHGETASVDWVVEQAGLNNHNDLIATNVFPSNAETNSWRGIFRINCDFSHSSYNDPIVYPGVENAAHLHRFYGNTLVDHTTDVDSLYTQGDSSCQGNQLNLSSYWLPALLAPRYDENGQRMLDEDGQPAWQVVAAVVGNDDVAHEVFYYSAGVDDLDSIQPLPAGLRMIAGHHMTQPDAPQDTSIVRWHCQTWESDDATNQQFSASIPECYEPDRVRLDIFFPSCWNGVDLDSDDHKSHMAYPDNKGGPQGTACPETHPIPVVRVSYHYAFGVKPEVSNPESKSSKGWRLASDMYEVNDEQAGGFSLHGDWFNGWHPSVMDMLLENCIKPGLDCHDGNLANGYRLSGTQPGTQIEPAILNQGIGN